MSSREQQTARVNVDDATWQSFRIRAIQAHRSVADELGRLVRNDLRRDGPIERPTLPADQRRQTNPSMPEPEPKADEMRPRRGQKQRLADLDLLTELPYRAQPPARR